MEIIPEWAPNLHPMVVHLPLAILSIAVLFDFVSFFLPEDQKWWTQEATASLYVIGAVTAIAVFFTGLSAADSVFLPTEAQSVLRAHEDWALWTVWFYGIYAAARFLATWKVSEEHRPKVHIAFFGLSLIGVFMLYQTGNNGAKMVFQYGVGVQTVQKAEEKPAGEEEEEIEKAFEEQENGDWNWGIDSGAVQVLQEQFHFITGDIGQLNAEAVAQNGSHLLEFTGNDLDAFWVTHGSYQNIQADYYLNLSDFDGTVTLTHHVQDNSNYDYVSITGNGMVEQGRLQDGEAEVFERGTADISELIFVRVVADGTHFRGYVDEEMVVHGHGDAPEAGNVGLKLDGSGTVLLERMELAQLTQE